MDYTYTDTTSSGFDWDKLHEYIRVVDYEAQPSPRYYIDWNLNNNANAIFKIIIEEPPEVDSASLLQLLSEDAV